MYNHTADCIDFNSHFFSYYGSQELSSTFWLPSFFKI